MLINACYHVSRLPAWVTSRPNMVVIVVLVVANGVEETVVLDLAVVLRALAVAAY